MVILRHISASFINFFYYGFSKQAYWVRKLLFPAHNCVTYGMFLWTISSILKTISKREGGSLDILTGWLGYLDLGESVTNPLSYYRRIEGIKFLLTQIFLQSNVNSQNFIKEEDYFGWIGFLVVAFSCSSNDEPNYFCNHKCVSLYSLNLDLIIFNFWVCKRHLMVSVKVKGLLFCNLKSYTETSIFMPSPS